VTIPPPDYGQEGPEFRLSSLTQDERKDIVNRAGLQGAATGFVSATAFHVTPLGATLDLEGNWPATPPPANKDNLAQWRQVTTEGRDQYVRVVEYGYLFPLGHRAVSVEITDRIFVPDPAVPEAFADAYLQYRTFIRVLQPLKAYPASYQPFSGNNWPFVSAQLLTLVTPDLDSSAVANGNVVGVPPNGGGYPQAFFPTYGGGNDVYWSIRFVDSAGTEVAARIPLVFVYGQGAGVPLDQYSGGDMQAIATAYNQLGQSTATPSSRVMSQVAGTPVRYAPEVTTAGNTAHPGVTTHPTLGIVLGAATPEIVPIMPLPGGSSATTINVPGLPSPSTIEATLEDLNEPAFYPSLLYSWVRLPAAESLSRSSFDDNTGPGGVAIGFYGDFVQGGFPSSLKPSGADSRGFDTNRPSRGEIAAIPANAGSVYAGLLNSPALNFPADAVGGVSNPNFVVSGLSAGAGAIGGTLDSYAQNAAASVQEYFSGLTSLLSNFLGGLPLGWLTSAAVSALVARPGIEEGPGTLVPGILGDFLGDLGVPGLTQSVKPDGTRVVTYTQQVSLKAFPESAPIFEPASSDGELTLTATVTIAPSGTTTYEAMGTMDPFTISVLGSGETLDLIEIPFGNVDSGLPGVSFTASSGAKSSFVPNIGAPTFQGVLTFVNTLEQFLEDLGGSGFSIDVAPTQVSLSLSLSLPSVGVGVFSLDNLGLSAGVVVPFLGGATVATFGFCSQEQPFTLTVCCFGGGGYFLLGVGLTSVQSLTASLDFEGQFGLDLGVASGSVSLVAGITFAYQVSAGASLTAFVRITGEVEVLGILSITLQLDLSLTYDFSTNVLTGTATMTVSVSIAFFSVSVGITVQKSFGGGGANSSAVLGHPDVTELPAATTYAPTFANQMSPSDWVAYCDAFAG
jgi:hypothetical protein